MWFLDYYIIIWTLYKSYYRDQKIHFKTKFQKSTWFFFWQSLLLQQGTVHKSIQDSTVLNSHLRSGDTKSWKNTYFLSLILFHSHCCLHSINYIREGNNVSCLQRYFCLMHKNMEDVLYRLSPWNLQSHQHLSNQSRQHQTYQPLHLTKIFLYLLIAKQRLSHLLSQ